MTHRSERQSAGCNEVIIAQNLRPPCCRRRQTLVRPGLGSRSRILCAGLSVDSHVGGGGCLESRRAAMGLRWVTTDMEARRGQR
jgi:hypothetical protein